MSALKRLPTEIWVKIFRYVLLTIPHHNLVEQHLVLQLACKEWWEIASSASALWAIIPRGLDIHGLSFRLHRAESCKLTIRCDDTDESLKLLPSDAILQHAQRWVHLETPILDANVFSKINAPSLAVIHLAVPTRVSASGHPSRAYLGSRPNFSISLDHFPALQVISLDCWNLLRPDTHLRALTSLTLVNSTLVDITDLIWIVAASEQLDSLTFHPTTLPSQPHGPQLSLSLPVHTRLRRVLIADVSTNLLKFLNLRIISENVVDFGIRLPLGEDILELLDALESIDQTAPTLFKSSDPVNSLPARYDTRLVVTWNSVNRTTERWTEARPTNARQIILVASRTMTTGAITKFISHIYLLVPDPGDPLILDLQDGIELGEGWNEVACNTRIVGIVLRSPNPVSSVTYLCYQRECSDHRMPHLPFMSLRTLALLACDYITLEAAILIRRRREVSPGNGITVLCNGLVINDWVLGLLDATYGSSRRPEFL